MTRAITISQQDTQLVGDQTRAYIRRSKSQRTQDIYKAALDDFEDYCHRRRVPSLPAAPQIIAEYLTSLVQRIDEPLKVSTLGIRLAALAQAHRAAGLPAPTASEIVRATMAGIRREHGTRPNKKEPATLDVLRAMIDATPGDDLTSLRNRAILLVGYGGAFRRSELAALDVGDVAIAGNHMTILIRRSKTDQEGKGILKHYPLLDDAALCPLRAMQAWLTHNGLKTGPLFRPIDRWGKLRNRRLTDKGIVLVIKAAAQRAGLNEQIFAGHSLRRGFVTTALRANAEERNVMAQTGHRDVNTMRGYHEDAGLGATEAVRAAFGEKTTR